MRALSWLRVTSCALPFLMFSGCDSRSPAAVGRVPSVPGSDVILVTVDTLRADHLSGYGHQRPTSPRIDAVAREGLLFRNAIAQAPWTLPSVASMHTGLYPSQHGAIHYSRKLEDTFTTLAEQLRAAGYHTAGVVSHDFAGSKYGLEQGFVAFDQNEIRSNGEITSPGLTERALQFVAEAPGDAPLFLWVHFFDPHYAYLRHPKFEFANEYDGPLLSDDVRLKAIKAHRKQITEADVEFVLAVYDEEIAHTDEWIGRLLDGVRDRRGERTNLTVITADHGEYFLERGLVGHGRDVFQPLVHVPLVIAGSGVEPGEVEAAVEVRGVARTILDYVGVESEAFGGARNLLQVASEPRAAGVVFSEGNYSRGHDGRKIAAVRDGWKLIYEFDDDRYELYDLRADPDELEAVDPQSVDGGEAVWSTLVAAIEAFREHQESESEGAEVDLSPEERRRLEALGYIQ